MRNIVVSALAALSLTAIATPAAAETISIGVPYGDLDLSSAAGMSTLDGRIKAAARKICGHAEVRDVHDGADHRQCMRSTRSSVSVLIARLAGKQPSLALNTLRR